MDAELLQQTPDYLLREQCEKALCEKSFYEFVKTAWKTVDASQYYDNWHIECLCVHLEALFNFEFPILDVTIPPAHAKSLVCSVLFPVWAWLQNPSLRFLTGSHSAELAIRDTLKSRSLIQSPWFQNHWGDKFALTSDQNTKGNYLNDQKGYRVAISVGSGTTGHRADIIIFDDAMSVGQAESDAERESINNYITQSLYNRQDILTETRICIIGQRLHPKDYHTIFLSIKGCLHINLPLEFEKENSFQSKYFTDPRTEHGEILWKIPKFIGEELERLKLMMGSRGYATQYQQRPSVQEGELFKRKDWGWYERKNLPPNIKKIAGWDFAAKEGKSNDYTACITLGKCGHDFYIIDLYRKKVEFPQAKRDFVAKSEEFNPATIYIEDKSNGSPLISEMNTTIYKYKIKPIIPKGNKEARAMAVSPIIEAGNVYLPVGAPWVETFLNECSDFPNGEHDDIVDALSMILNNERQNIVPRVAFLKN